MICHVENTAGFDREFIKLDGYTQSILEAWIKKIWKVVLIQGSRKDQSQTGADSGDIE